MKMFKNITLGLLLAFAASTMSHAAKYNTPEEIQTKLSSGSIHGSAKNALERRLAAMQTTSTKEITKTKENSLYWGAKTLCWSLPKWTIGRLFGGYSIYHAISASNKLYKLDIIGFCKETGLTIKDLFLSLLIIEAVVFANEKIPEDLFLASRMMTLFSHFLPKISIPIVKNIMLLMTEAPDWLKTSITQPLHATLSTIQNTIHGNTLEIYNEYQKDIQRCDDRGIFKSWLTSRESCLEEAGVPAHFW